MESFIGGRCVLCHACILSDNISSKWPAGPTTLELTRLLPDPESTYPRLYVYK